MLKKISLSFAFSLLLLVGFAANKSDDRLTKNNVTNSLGYNLRPIKLFEILILPIDKKEVAEIKKGGRKVFYEPIFEVPRLKLSPKTSNSNADANIEIKDEKLQKKA